VTSPWTTLLSGVVGSHAYGLAGPNSDVDTLAVAAAPTVEFHGLHPPTGKSASRVTTNPDVTVHEAAKYVGLCLAANPTVTELLWLPNGCYVERHPLGNELLLIRKSLLGARRVRDAYLGYATSQFTRIRNRGTTFSSDTRARTAKHARHLLRLIANGTQLYLTGHLDVRLANPAHYLEFGELVAEDPVEGIRRAENALAMASATLDALASPLPEYPDPAPAEAWLRRVRRQLLDATESPPR
jgi:predicted nucleotidyltransferase